MNSIDAHCHIQFDAYAEDRESVVARMEQAGVGGIVVGVDALSSREAVLLASRYPHLRASVGFHPGYVTEERYTTDDFIELVAKDGVVAIGECGLDYFREKDRAVYRLQREVFEAQVQLAAEQNLPLMIHARPSSGSVDAYTDVITILTRAKEKYHDRVRGNIHFFVGGIPELSAFNALNFTVSVTGVITFTNDYDSVVTNVPKDMLLAETDAPYVTPVPHRGKRNEPRYVIEVVKRIAELWDMPYEETQKVLFANTKRVFFN